MEGLSKEAADRVAEKLGFTGKQHALVRIISQLLMVMYEATQSESYIY